MRAKAVVAWAATQAAWVEEQLRQSLPAEPFVPDAIIPVEGADTLLRWSNGPRAAKLGDGILTCGGPVAGFPRRVELFLKRFALERLSAETAEYALLAEVKATSVSIGDARTRWGSCSSRGAIRYNWRLILAPAEARRFVVAHEVAHLKHLNHGRDFKQLERDLLGGNTAAAEKLLREWGPRLRRIGVGR